MPAKTQPDFAVVHAGLRAIMQKYEGGSLQVTADAPGNFVLVGPATERSRGRELWFGAVQTRKSYVSYHLMAVYAFPDLLEGMSPELKKRMQGKACFNFKSVDDRLFNELARLTGRGFRRFMKAKMIG